MNFEPPEASLFQKLYMHDMLLVLLLPQVAFFSNMFCCHPTQANAKKSFVFDVDIIRNH